MRITLAAIMVLAGLGVIGFVLFWPKQPTAAETATIETLMADMETTAKEIDQAIAEFPEIARPEDLERVTLLTQKSQEFVDRAKELPPRLRGPIAKRFSEAQAMYLQKTYDLGDKLKAMSKAWGERKK